MANFNGTLIYIGKNSNGSNVTYEAFPHSLIAKDSYQSTPLQRTELKAYRDTQNKLHRVTSPNYKSKIVFQTTPLNLSQLKNIRGILKDAFINSQQRKLRVMYWDEELLDYRKMVCYMPDITYTTSVVKGRNIKYQALELTFIEY